jgi:hypothetical protein
MANYTFAQGQLAPFYGLFVLTPSGQPTNVPDATIEIFGPGNSVVLAATPMVQAGTTTGLYYYEWQVPNSLSADTYTVMISGTVAGTPTAQIQTVAIVPAGTISNTVISVVAADLIAALEIYLGCAQHVTVENELASRSTDMKEYQLYWANWNLTNPDVRINNRKIAPTDALFPYSIDFNAGIIRFENALRPEDNLKVSYNFRMFTDTDLLRFISDAVSELNSTAPMTGYTIDNFPFTLIGPVMMGARKNAMLKLMLCIQFQNTQTIFGDDKESKAAAYAGFKDIKENSEKSFTEMRKEVKKALPRIAMISTPEYTLPGGRSRWFRYLFSSGLG